MRAPTVLAEIVFSGPRAGRWHSRDRQVFAAHITVAGQIWADHFVPALAPDAVIKGAGVSLSAAQVRAAICRGWKACRQLPAYRSGERMQADLPETRGTAVAVFTLPKLEEAASSAHCGGPACAYGFFCECRCPRCGVARTWEL